MGLVSLETQAPPSVHSLELGVLVSGMKITVQAGSFRISGVDYLLNDDQEFDAASDPDEETAIDGYLVQDKDDDSVSVLVDTRVGLEDSYRFPPDGPYRLLESLWQVVVPAGAVALDSVDVRVKKIVPPPARPVPGPPNPPAE